MGAIGYAQLVFCVFIFTNKILTIPIHTSSLSLSFHLSTQPSVHPAIHKSAPFCPLCLSDGRSAILLACLLCLSARILWRHVHHCAIYLFTCASHGPLARYVRLRVAHAPRMPGTFSLLPRVSDPDMHHGTCVTHVPWCMPESLTSGFLLIRWRGKRSRHSRRMRSP